MTLFLCFEHFFVPVDLFFWFFIFISLNFALLLIFTSIFVHIFDFQLDLFLSCSSCCWASLYLSFGHFVTNSGSFVFRELIVHTEAHFLMVTEYFYCFPHSSLFFPPYFYSQLPQNLFLLFTFGTITQNSWLFKIDYIADHILKKHFCHLNANDYMKPAIYLLP